MGIETTPEQSLSLRRGPVTPGEVGMPTALESGALRLLACAALVVLLVCLLILPSGPSETDETLSWLLAVAVAIPAGLALAAYQARALSGAGPGALSYALATATALLALALFLRRLGTGDQLHHAVLALAAAAALAAPLLVARFWRDAGDRATAAARAVALLSLVFIVVLFLPERAREPKMLLPALALAALATALVRSRLRQPLSGRAGWALDGVLCAVLALVVIQLPDILTVAVATVHHHGFFLGPANDALHGRAILGGAWSQYGTGLIDALALVFTVVPIGYGTLALIVVALTALQYLCVYATVRLAGVGQVLAVLTMAVAVLGNLFYPLDLYIAYPSVSALRFGFPYLMVLCAVAGARHPAREGLARSAVLALLALAAVWSFETFVYSAATYGSLVLVEAVCAGTGIVRRLFRAAVFGLACSAVAVAVFSLLTLIFDGNLDWGPYFEYLRLYTVGELGELPVIFFSAGPLMAAAIFSSAVTLLWLVRERPQALAAPLRAGLAGFTGFAIATFTYYLGRSHPNNLLVLLVPVLALAALWTQALLSGPSARWRTAAIAAIMLGGSMIAVASWPWAELKWKDTALGLAIPRQGGSLRQSFETLAHNPVFNPQAEAGVSLLAERLPPAAPALVLLEPNLTTEVLLRSGRRNVLPISDPLEDALIRSSWRRVRLAVDRVPAGALLLTSFVSVSTPANESTGVPGALNDLQKMARTRLLTRFASRPVQQTPDGLILLRLVARG